VCVAVQCRDAADDHLTAELVHLDNLKKMLESHLNLVKIQLQTLNAARERLAAVFRERARVIDLLCYAVPCIGIHSRLESMGPFCVTRSNPIHQLTDTTQPNPLQVGKFGRNPTQPNTTLTV